MKGNILGLIGTIAAVLSLVIQFVKEIITVKKEKSDTLLLKLCNQIEFCNGVYKLKIINISPCATAYDLHVTLRLQNRHLRSIYKFADFINQSNIYSVNKGTDKEACEILINIDAMRIEKKYFEAPSSYDIKNLFKENRLELRHMLADKESCLSVRYYAVNRATGKTVDFDQHDFYYRDIVSGRFGVGNDYVTQL